MTTKTRGMRLRSGKCVNPQTTVNSKTTIKKTSKMEEEADATTIVSYPGLLNKDEDAEKISSIIFQASDDDESAEPLTGYKFTQANTSGRRTRYSAQSSMYTPTPTYIFIPD